MEETTQVNTSKKRGRPKGSLGKKKLVLLENPKVVLETIENGAQTA